MHYYTGIGSRKTPSSLRDIINNIAFNLSEKNFCLRSGGAIGADTFFEEAATYKEIYLPKDVNLAIDPAMPIAQGLLGPSHWANLTEYAAQCHTRNVNQVLGANLDSPSKFLVCWTPDAKDVGGTATAIKLAREVGIPVFNLANPGSVEKLESCLKVILNAQAKPRIYHCQLDPWPTWDYYVGPVNPMISKFLPGGNGQFANPFADELGTHDDHVAYSEWIITQSSLLEDLKVLRGKSLACWCAPVGGIDPNAKISCHAQVLYDLANS